MKTFWLTLVMLGIASAANATPIQDATLTNAVTEIFPSATIIARSPECKSTVDSATEIGMVVQTDTTLRAMVATAGTDGWAITDLPRNVEYSRGSMLDFLDEFNSAETRKLLQVRCTHPNTDEDINTRINGAFIANRGKDASARHLCFTASSTYNSWVCYWTKSRGSEPEVSFVQFNAD